MAIPDGCQVAQQDNDPEASIAELILPRVCLLIKVVWQGHTHLDTIITSQKVSPCHCMSSLYMWPTAMGNDDTL